MFLRQVSCYCPIAVYFKCPTETLQLYQLEVENMGMTGRRSRKRPVFSTLPCMSPTVTALRNFTGSVDIAMTLIQEHINTTNILNILDVSGGGDYMLDIPTIEI